MALPLSAQGMNLVTLGRQQVDKSVSQEGRNRVSLHALLYNGSAIAAATVHLLYSEPKGRTALSLARSGPVTLMQNRR